MVYTIGKLIIPPICKLWIRRVEGLKNIPKDEPFIIASNHASFCDAIILHSLIIPEIDKKIHAFVHSLFWKYYIPGFFLNWAESIPVFGFDEQDAKSNNITTFSKALDYLNKGEIVEIFPEGTRSYDGKLKKAHKGVAYLTLKSNAPVLPVGIIGSNKVLPIGKKLPRLRRCDVKVGKLISFEKYHAKGINNKLLEEVTRLIMNQIAILIEQKYDY